MSPLVAVKEAPLELGHERVAAAVDEVVVEVVETVDVVETVEDVVPVAVVVVEFDEVVPLRMAPHTDATELPVPAKEL